MSKPTVADWQQYYSEAAYLKKVCNELHGAFRKYETGQNMRNSLLSHIRGSLREVRPVPGQWQRMELPMKDTSCRVRLFNDEVRKYRGRALSHSTRSIDLRVKKYHMGSVFELTYGKDVRPGMRSFGRIRVTFDEVAGCGSVECFSGRDFCQKLVSRREWGNWQIGFRKEVMLCRSLYWGIKEGGEEYSLYEQRDHRIIGLLWSGVRLDTTDFAKYYRVRIVPRSFANWDGLTVAFAMKTRFGDWFVADKLEKLRSTETIAFAEGFGRAVSV
ncbi:MAG: hypothetical protein KatS3mg109_0091 [Pirellulaceae bacterium]|nr:MAG: hypothetical protein KatS3mg109_0091 [Pirellulaceae bacterium]